MKFFRFNAGLAAILIAIALAFRYGAPATPARVGRSALALLALDVAEAALVLYWATVGRDAGARSVRRSSARRVRGGLRRARAAGARASSAGSRRCRCRR